MENQDTKEITEKRKSNSTPLYIIRDTRESEEHGWAFDKSSKHIKIEKIWNDKLDAGDYTLIGHEFPTDSNSIIIERKKSIEEFLNNIGTNWDRFQRELEQLSKYKFAHILIEDDFHIIKQRYDSYRSYITFPPEFILKRISDIQVNFNVSTHFLTNSYYAQQYCLYLFRDVIEKESKLDE